MRWRRKREPEVRLIDRMDELQWAREHDEPVPYTPVVLVDPTDRDRKPTSIILATRSELALAWAYTMSSQQGLHSVDALIHQLKIVQGRA